ncbi:MAG: hypothetical protein J6M60_07245 [Clostridia bacterium]|nr:hypothetical protein [Clostridia bacterium]
MSKTVERTNSIKDSLKNDFKDLGEFLKNFSSIFGDEKFEDKDLETLIYEANEYTAKTAIELAKSQKDIASGEFENIKTNSSNVHNQRSLNTNQKENTLKEKEQNLDSLINSYSGLDASIENQQDHDDLEH